MPNQVLHSRIASIADVADSCTFGGIITIARAGLATVAGVGRLDLHVSRICTTKERGSNQMADYHDEVDGASGKRGSSVTDSFVLAKRESYSAK